MAEKTNRKLTRINPLKKPVEPKVKKKPMFPSNKKKKNEEPEIPEWAKRFNVNLED